MKNLIIVILLGMSAHSAMAEIRTKDLGPLTNDAIFSAEDFHFTALSAPDLEYGTGELWLQGMLIFNIFFYPEPISVNLNIKTPVEVAPGLVFTSSFVTSNFPCGHFGDWAKLGFFPTSSSDSDIQECGLESKLPVGVKSINIDLQPIPEPKTYAMILVGLILMGLASRREPFHRI